MRPCATLLLSSALLAAPCLQAQNTGETAVATAKAVQSNDWKNWTFAAITLAVAAGAVLFVSLNDGRPAHD